MSGNNQICRLTAISFAILSYFLCIAATPDTCRSFIRWMIHKHVHKSTKTIIKLNFCAIWFGDNSGMLFLCHNNPSFRANSKINISISKKNCNNNYI